MSKTAHHVQVRISNNCESFIGESLYLTGSFINWEDHVYMGSIPQLGGTIEFDLGEVKSGDLELKLSRGNWDTLTATKDGQLTPAQVEKIHEDSIVELSIDAWRDQFPKSTASKQVHILDEHFFLPDLNVYRKVWIYLPKDYQASEKRYPVIYMHDGQHLFDEATSVGRAGPIEWMVDETIDAASNASIVVAIDHAQNYGLRQEEYLIHPGHGSEKAKGWAYLDDIVHTLKPFVDNNYRTLSDAQHTAIIGSSLAGLLSIYAGLKYPEVFGTVAPFSPSIWMDEVQLYAYSSKVLLEKSTDRLQQEFYFYIGELERRFRLMDNQNNMKLDLEKYYHWLEDKYNGILQLVTAQGAKHGAIYWQEAFRKFYAYWETKLIS